MRDLSTVQIRLTISLHRTLHPPIHPIPPIRIHIRTLSGSLTTRLANETRLVDQGFGNSVARQVQVLFTLVIAVCIGFNASWQIALVVVACLPLNILAATVQSAVASGQQ